MKEITEFSLVGQLLGFVIKDGYKLKYLKMTVGEHEYWIKLDKELRNTLDPEIVPGVWLEVTGTREIERKKRTLKLKADTVKLASVVESEVKTTPNIETKKNQASILICQKSSCWQKGGREVCARIEETLSDRGLTEEVKIKKTGCLKQCKMGPNLVIMPNKARYSNVKPEQVANLLAVLSPK